ncbi:BadF/BadG/BcrA/BcrD ATPase family protein [Microbacterium sp. 22242]|uniref:BadF/BadG/BcrA/BcrD ATPase family protein n=1 Tax=Microbacterium sp. 22242 TaxID=3453896 RepID=UPI003F834493
MTTAAPRSILAVDAGQSSIKIRHSTGGDVTDWSTSGIRTDIPLMPQLGAVLADAGRRGLGAEAVGIGVSGLTAAATDAEELMSVAARSGARALSIAHDSITAFLGALGDNRGAVVAVGTGVVTLAVGRTEIARVDGWGYLLGDAGSGFWIGRAALDAVLRANDGRGPATALTDVVRAEFPVLEDAYIELQADQDRVRRVAAYARTVAEVAAAGDEVAAAISAAAADELAHSVASGLRRVGEIGPDGRDRAGAGASGESVHVRAVGGAWGSVVLADAFVDAVRRRLPGADVRVVRADPLDGAMLLPSVSHESPLRAQAVHVTA